MFARQAPARRSLRGARLLGHGQKATVPQAVHFTAQTALQPEYVLTMGHLCGAFGTESIVLEALLGG